MRLAIIGASEEAIHTIEIAHKLGIEVVAIDGNPAAKGLEAADIPIVVNITDEEATIDVISELGVDWIQTVPIGRYLTTTGAVNDALNLPGITREMANICTDKWMFHNKLFKAGLRDCNCYQVRNGEVNDYSVEFPAILKPRWGSGSRGIYIVNSKEELVDCLPYVADEDYILEDCVDGDEYGVDAAVINGELSIVLLRLKDNTPLPNRQAVAYYSVPVDDPFYKEVSDYLKRVVEVIGLDECLLHGDIVRGCKGPFAIEISARPSGHNLHNLFTPLCTGVDMAEEYMKARMGDKYSFVPEYTKDIMIHYFDYKGRAGHIPDEAEVRTIVGDRLLEWKCNINAGEKLEEAGNGHALMGRGYYIVEGGRREEADKIKALFEL